MSQLAINLIRQEKATKTGYLDIGNCELTELPDELFDCVWLETLIVANKYWDMSTRKWITSKNFGQKNVLSVIPIKIERLTNLKKLIIGDFDAWEISDISPLHSLQQLTYLDITDNEPITNLSLCDNQISDISFLKDLKQLQSLFLNSNQISDISFLKNLKQLQSLSLCDNQISDISFLKDLKQLQSLSLNDNKISDISPLLGLIKKGLMPSLKQFQGRIQLYKNPITIPPPETIARGREATIQFLESHRKSHPL